jgi:hypothetical protein
VLLNVLFAIGIAVVVIALQQHKVSLFGFRVSLLLMTGGWAAFQTVLFRRLRRLPANDAIRDATMQRSRWTSVRIWLLRGLIAMMVITLFWANWVERHGPLLPRITGTIANLGLTWLYVIALRALQNKGKYSNRN